MTYDDPNLEWNKHEAEQEQEARLDALTAELKKHEQEREARIKRDTAEGIDYNAFVAENARWSWTENGLDFWLCVHPALKHWCGYVRFPKRPLQEPRFRGIVTYVPVHGGVSWAQESPDGSFVYGFDCNHNSDRERPPGLGNAKDFMRRLRKAKKTRDESWLVGRPKRRTFKWLKGQVLIMAAGIQTAVRYEPAYLAAENDQQKRAEIIDQFHRYLRREALGKFVLEDNCMAMINLFGGRL